MDHSGVVCTILSILEALSKVEGSPEVSGQHAAVWAHHEPFWRGLGVPTLTQALLTDT
jgi:hypothetical protein